MIRFGTYNISRRVDSMESMFYPFQRIVTPVELRDRLIKMNVSSVEVFGGFEAGVNKISGTTLMVRKRSRIEVGRISDENPEVLFKPQNPKNKRYRMIWFLTENGAEQFKRFFGVSDEVFDYLGEGLKCDLPINLVFVG